PSSQSILTDREIMSRAMSVPRQKKNQGLITLIPSAATAIAQIDSLGQQDEGFRSEGEFHLARVAHLRPGEGALFETLAHHPETGPVIIEEFDPVAPLIGEGEEGSAFRILLESFFHEGIEAVE